MRKERALSEAQADVVIAWLPALVLLVVLPLTVYLNNQSEFDYNFSVVFPLLLFAAVSLLGGSILCVLESIRRTNIALTLFYLGLFFLLSDILAPVQWGLLDGERLIDESSRHSLMQLLITSILAIFAARTPPDITRRFGTVLVFVLLILQPIEVFRKLSPETVWSSTGELDPPGQATGVQRPSPGVAGNVYHLVFDGYSSLAFLDALRSLGASEVFRGFTFFQDNLSNYNETDASVPSFLTGKFYTAGSFRQWQRKAKESGLIGRLQEAGFEIDVYSPNRTRPWTYENATNITTNRDILDHYFWGMETLSLLQICIVRVSPDFLRREAFGATSLLFGKLLWAVDGAAPIGGNTLNSLKRYPYYKRMSVRLLQEFLSDERVRRPHRRYVYVHAILPHAPFVWNRNCEYSDGSGFGEQTMCATRLMAEVLTELRALERFENSLVIIQSDHGYQGTAAGNSPLEMPQSIAEIIESRGTIPPDGYLRRLHSLLLVKPPFAPERPLTISQAPTQLVDIPATVYDSLDMPGESTEGVPVFSLQESDQREVNIYVGVYSNGEGGSTLRLGENTSAAKIAHFSYIRGRGWRVYPELDGKQ